MKLKASLSVVLSSALTFIPVVQGAQPVKTSNGNGNSSNGNSGNGVGNSSSGNQGNSSTNGNSGSGSTTGGASGSSSNGNSNSTTGGLNGGNSGNGVGNTGSGNQGNTTSNGNAGGSTTGGTSGSSSSGNSSSNTGGLNGGNNGNGVGNTGAGNQGNETTNGNAGGSTTGGTSGSSSNGNSNSDTGGLNGGNNGNGAGNTGPGNQGNDSSNGNAGGTSTSGNNGTITSGSNGGNNGSSTSGSNGGNNGSSTSGSNGGNNGSSTSGSNGGNNGSSTSGSNGGNNGSSTSGSNDGNNGSSTSGSNGGNNGSSTSGSNGGNNGSSTSGSNGGDNGSSTSGSNGGNNGSSTSGSNGGNNGSSTSGSTNGSTSGGVTGGETTGSTTSGSTSGGTTTGVETTGSTTSGSTTGGTTTGGTTGSTTSGSTSGGSSTGGDTTGSTTGGSTTGDTTGGSTTGDTSGGSTTGNTTGGSTTGDTTGGSTTGDTTGGSTTGDTTGGSTTGDDSSGSTTGDSNGGTTGDSTGGDQGGDKPSDNTDDGKDDTKPVEETKPEVNKPKVKVRVLPLVFGSYDIQKKIVNLTPGELPEANHSLELDQFRNGFQVSLMKTYDAGLGVAAQAYVDNATGIMAASTGIVGLAVTKSRLVQYERFVSTERDIYNLKTLPIPFKGEALSAYKTGESVYFENMGGLLFLGGANVGVAFAGGSVVAEGGFKTLITKSASDKVTVQLVKANVKKTTLFTGVGVFRIEAGANKQLNHGFSYTFDLTSKEAVTAYERLLTGNAVPAQSLAARPFSGVEAVESYADTNRQRTRNVVLGIPMVFIYNWTTGKTYGQTDTIYHSDNSKTELHYGVFFKEMNGRFFHDHKKLVRSFYSGEAVNKSMNNEVRGIDQSATYFWSYENDSARSGTFTKALRTLQKDLGLRAEFNPSVDSRENLGYVKLESELVIPYSYTKRLMDLENGKRLGVLNEKITSLINNYFAKGDVDNICQNDDGEMQSGADLCKENLIYDTVYSVGKVRNLLSQMSKTTKASEFVALQALIGKEIVRNQFILTSLFTVDSSCEVNFNVKIEGQRFSKTTKTIPANPECR